MKLIYLNIKNFRNLNNQEIFFNENLNFIVGENNIGKSNLLELLEIIFRRRNFNEDDFEDKSKPIEIIFSILFDDIERGIFDDLFDSDNINKINIIARQNNIMDYIEFFHLETNTSISTSNIRNLNFLYYNSIRDPIIELNFDKNRGTGKFLNYIIKSKLETKSMSEKDLIETNKLDELVKEINIILKKIKSFSDYKIKANIEENIDNILTKIIVLRDDNKQDISKSGHGVQFLLLITLSILERLLIINNLKSDRGIFQFDDDKKAISLIVGFDEPEIHLHPHMQRALIKYLKSIINNEDNDFSEILNQFFNIQKISGQLIIVTHSPNILLNNYKEIIRMYYDKNAIKVKSGIQINLNEQFEKHLLIQLPFIKEAFFSKSVILVEGDSEIGCFSLFAEKINKYDFDKLGITVIKTHSADAVEIQLKLLKDFGVPSVGIIDKDLDKKNKYPLVLKTNEKDFEAEIVIKLLKKNKLEVLKQIVCDYDKIGISRILKKETLEKRIDNTKKNNYKQYFPVSLTITNDLKLEDIYKTNNDLLKLWYLTWFSINKTIILGRIIGLVLTKDEIPEIYIKVIDEAIKLIK